MTRFMALDWTNYVIYKPLLRGYIKEALKHDDALSLHELEYGIRRREQLPLVMVENGKMLGCLLLEKLPDAVLVTALGGDLAGRVWLDDAVAAVRDVARTQGKSKISAKGRRGWMRILRHYRPKCRGEYMEIKVA